MRITEEMLYETAPAAAERYLEALPGREACAHVFSPDFEERMRLLAPGRKKKLLKRVVLEAACLLYTSDAADDANRV